MKKNIYGLFLTVFFSAYSLATNNPSISKEIATSVVQLIQNSADQGDAEAQNNLGAMYADGKGVIKNDKQAVYWYEKAANQGNASAQYNLGVRYANGEGVSKNYALANIWALLAKYNGMTSNELLSFLDKKTPQYQKKLSQSMAQQCLNSKYLKCI